MLPESGTFNRQRVTEIIQDGRSPEEQLAELLNLAKGTGERAIVEILTQEGTAEEKLARISDLAGIQTQMPEPLPSWTRDVE